MSRFSIACILFALLAWPCACDEAKEAAPVASASCATPGPPCPLAPNESCQPCFARIAECCYKDKDVQGRIGELVEACEKRTECRRCCDECAAKTCEQLVAEKSCPAVL